MTSTLTVWKYPTAGGAEEAEQILLDLQTESLIIVDDAAIVYWEHGAKRPKTRSCPRCSGSDSPRRGCHRRTG